MVFGTAAVPPGYCAYTNKSCDHSCVIDSDTPDSRSSTASQGITASVECGKGFKALRGELSLSGGQLRFQTQDACVFEVAVTSIEKIVWHWYSFGGAFEATIRGKSYFLSFVPRRAGLGSWYAGLTTGRQWRAALEGRPAPTGGPLIARIFWDFTGWCASSSWASS